MFGVNIGWPGGGFPEQDIFKILLAEEIKAYYQDAAPTFQDRYSIITKPLDTIQFIETLFKFPGKVFSYSSTEYFLMTKDNWAASIYLNTRERYSSIVFNIYTSSLEILRKARKEIEVIYKGIRREEFSINVRWYYYSAGDIDFSSIAEVFDDIIYQEAYPYIPDLFTFINKYITSREQALILIGPPGTGKTRLIRYILKELVRSRADEKKMKHPNGIHSRPDSQVGYGEDREEYYISYTSDDNVLNHDDIFIALLSGSSSALVLEDIDFHLRDRKEGNTVMQRLLGATDGLIVNSSKKVIVSTNIESEKNIDEAFIRPGRCFGIINTRLLTSQESLEFLDKIDVKIDYSILENRGYSLAELYRYIHGDFRHPATRTRKSGF